MTDDEIKRLTKCASEWRGTTFAADLSALLDEVERLRVELAEAKRDAERWRYARDHMTYMDIERMDSSGPVWTRTRRWYHDSFDLDAKTIDAAIDAARGAG